MSGFPSRVTRGAFGPTFQNVGKMTNPASNANAQLMNLLAWQAAGMSGLVPRGLRICTVAASVLTKGRKWLSWDADGALADTAFDVVRAGAGTYTWALSSSTFADMDGNMVQVACDWAMAIPIGTTNLNMIADVNANGYQGTANCFTANTGSAVDPAKFVLLIG